MPLSRAGDALGPGHLDHAVLADVLGYRLAQATIPTNAIFRARIADPFGLNKLEFSLLMLVSGNAEVTPKRLSIALNVPGPNLTLLLDRLEERGQIERRRSEEDRRVQHVLLTRKGRALVGRLRGTIATMEEDLLGHLTEAERAMLFELLKKVAAHRRG